MIPAYDNIVHLDIESYYDTRAGYTLTKMPTINYVRDPRFEVLGVAVAWNDDPSVYMSHEEFAEWAADVDWSRTAVQAFNCAFDGTVLTEHYGIYPAYYICSKSVAKALLPIDKHNLKTVAPLLGLGEKGDALVSGSRKSTKELADYACNDNELARGIYKMLYPMVSKAEQDLIHLTVRGWAEPELVLDEAVLQQVLDDTIRERDALIKASGYSESSLTSNPQFAKIIADLGLVAPTKLSATTGEETEAFAKGDDEFVEFMLSHPQHKALWEARLAAKSNINIRRPEKFLSIAALAPNPAAPTTPMPLNYCGAHTGRWSGGDGLNVQNLPNKYKSNLRLAFCAPKGYVIVVVDSSQIELRLNMWFAGQTDKLELLRNGGDIYVDEAASQFGIAPEDVKKDQRQFGKVTQLGAGFGMGANKFRKYCAAGPLGMDPIYLSPSEAYSSIMTYRTNNPKIPEQWRALDERIHQMTLPGLREQHGCVTFVHEGIELPSGRMLQYPGLHQHESGSWVYGIDKKIKYLWGGTLDENIIQALARDVVAEQILKIESRYRVVSSTHDEAIYLARESEAEEALRFGIEVFSAPPAWAPDLPVSAEGGYAVNYSK